MSITLCVSVVFFFFNDTATTEIYTLSLHDALPICPCVRKDDGRECNNVHRRSTRAAAPASPEMAGARPARTDRSEEHTSELQSHVNLVCRLLLEKKKKKRCNYAAR